MYLQPATTPQTQVCSSDASWGTRSAEGDSRKKCGEEQSGQKVSHTYIHTYSTPPPLPAGREVGGKKFVTGSGGKEEKEKEDVEYSMY